MLTGIVDWPGLATHFPPCRLYDLDGPQEDWRRQDGHGLSCILPSSTRDPRPKGQQLPGLALRDLFTIHPHCLPHSHLLLTPPPLGLPVLGKFMLPGYGGPAWTLDMASAPQSERRTVRTPYASISKMTGDLASCMSLVSETKEIARGTSAACCPHTSPTMGSVGAWLPHTSRSYHLWGVTKPDWPNTREQGGVRVSPNCQTWSQGSCGRSIPWNVKTARRP